MNSSPTGLNPIELLWRFDGLARQFASPLPQRIQLKQNWEGIGFRLLDTNMVVPVKQVAEILMDFRLTPIPGVKPWLLGISNVRGILIPMLDLAGLLGGVSSVPIARKKVFLVSHQQMIAGLCIDDVLGIRRFDVEAFQPEITTRVRALRPLLNGSYRNSDDEIWPVIDLLRLMEQDEFRQIAA